MHGRPYWGAACVVLSNGKYHNLSAEKIYATATFLKQSDRDDLS